MPPNVSILFDLIFLHRLCKALSLVCRQWIIITKLLVGCCLAPKVRLPAMGGAWVIIGYSLMMKEVMGQQNVVIRQGALCLAKVTRQASLPHCESVTHFPIFSADSMVKLHAHAYQQ